MYIFNKVWGVTVFAYLLIVVDARVDGVQDRSVATDDHRTVVRFAGGQLHPERAGIPGRDDAATIAAICRQHKLARAKVRRRFCWWSPVQ